MQHDVIMDPSKHDYMIIENEAARVAKDAAKALKRSRSFCNNAITGLPTWTGQSGIKKWETLLMIFCTVLLNEHCNVAKKYKTANIESLNWKWHFNR